MSNTARVMTNSGPQMRLFAASDERGKNKAPLATKPGTAGDLDGDEVDEAFDQLEERIETLRLEVKSLRRKVVPKGTNGSPPTSA